MKPDGHMIRFTWGHKGEVEEADMTQGSKTLLTTMATGSRTFPDPSCTHRNKSTETQEDEIAETRGRRKY